VRPEAPAPDLWHQDLVRGLGEGEANLQSWWTLLDDPPLVSLVERSARQNLDILQAVARLDQARAQRGIARGAWFPSASTFGDYTRFKGSEEIVAVPGIGEEQGINRIGIDATWEIDVFGRIRRSVESATAGLEASLEDYRDVLVAVFAEVALNYVDVRTFQQRLRYALRNVENQRDTLQLVLDRNRAGLVGDLDVRQAEQNLASTEATIPDLRTGLALAIHRLGVLLGEPPAALYAELSDPGDIPTPPERVLVGVPRDVLRQRPDVRSAERQLAAQTAQIGVATADFYPRLAILGTFAFSALDAAKLFTGKASNFSFGPTLTWNIFDGGRIRSNVHVQEGLSEELLSGYEQTVLRAYEDVENSMVSYVQEQERRDALDRSVTASRQAVELVKTLYRTGLTNFQNVLDTERSLFLAEDDLAASEGLVTQNLIRVYRALGGGWTP
jgi:NodT family efflux transporter outer membrane factor (OMF) lipoprotein